VIDESFDLNTLSAPKPNSLEKVHLGLVCLYLSSDPVETTVASSLQASVELARLDLFLDGVLGDKAEHLDFAFLADSMSAISELVNQLVGFQSESVENDYIGGLEVDPEATGSG
jgi:hypothetical protein